MKQLFCLIACIFFAFAVVFLYVTALDVAFAMYSGQEQSELLGLRAEMTLLVITVLVFIGAVCSFVGYYMLYTEECDSHQHELDTYERSSI